MDARQQGKAAGGQEANLVSPPLSSASQAALLNVWWNPTQEQLVVLEGLFENGVRMPNAKQIQHITARLWKHGPVEAKNITYWFQNHKAHDRNSHNQEGFSPYTSLMPTSLLPYLLTTMLPSPPLVLTMAPMSAATEHNNDGAGGHGT